MIRRILVAAAAALTLLAFAANAQASSIVFIRGGDVWLTTPDGSREHRVTTGGAYSSVTQADDGRIFASAGGILHSFAPDGRRLAGPTGTGHTLDLDVSPDGSKLAFWYASGDGGRHTVINSDGTPAPEWDDQSGWYPTWITNDLTLQSNGAGYLETAHSGLGGWTYWTGNPEGRKYSSAITRAADRLVAVVRDYDGVGPWSVAHYANASQPPRESAGPDPFEPPPADQQPVLRCIQDYGTTEPSHPSFSPDGTAIAWEHADGVHVRPVFDLNACSQPPGGFTIAGAGSPDWGPADVPTAAAPPTNVDPGAGDVPAEAAPPPRRKKCVVPKLKGKKLRAAKKALRKARCKLGKVRKARSSRKPRTVIKQRPRPGKRRRAGSKVRVVLAKRPRAAAAMAQTAAGVEVEPPVVTFAGLEGDIFKMAVYDVVVRASSDVPKDRWHVSLTFCDHAGACEPVGTITDTSGDDPRTTQTWPDPARGVPELEVRLLPDQRGTLEATWEVYTWHEYAWEGAKTYEAPPVPIGPAPGGGASDEEAGSGGTPGGAAPDIRIARRTTAKGLRVDISCGEACGAKAKLVVSRRTARRLGLKTTTVARLQTRLPRAGARRAWLRLTPKAARRLLRVRTVRAKADGRVVDASGRSARHRVSARLHPR